MGRAQIVQAEAARVAPTADMNPVLLKPNTDTGAQVVLQGKVSSTESAKGYFRDTSKWAAAAFESLHRLMAKHELLVIEGAGSCAEMNLYKRDFVNFRTAREAGASVILVADIDRGGVFAQVVGTLSVLPPEDRLLVKGVIINRFRGDIELFRDGVEMIEKMAGIPVLGVIPISGGLRLTQRMLFRFPPKLTLPPGLLLERLALQSSISPIYPILRTFPLLKRIPVLISITFIIPDRLMATICWCFQARRMCVATLTGFVPWAGRRRL